MKIEELRIGQVVYNTDNEKLKVEILTAETSSKPKVYARDHRGYSQWYKPDQLQEKPLPWVNLGLPSGTLWKSDIERDENGQPLYLTYDKAKDKYGSNLPKSWQFAELYEECEWKWDAEKNGYEIVGPNGNSIFLPAEGHKEEPFDVKNGYYWSAMPSISYNTSYYLHINSSGVFTHVVSENSSRLTIILCKTK